MRCALHGCEKRTRTPVALGTAEVRKAKLCANRLAGATRCVSGSSTSVRRLSTNAGEPRGESTGQRRSGHAATFHAIRHANLWLRSEKFQGSRKAVGPLARMTCEIRVDRCGEAALGERARCAASAYGFWTDRRGRAPRASPIGRRRATRRRRSCRTAALRASRANSEAVASFHDVSTRSVSRAASTRSRSAPAPRREQRVCTDGHADGKDDDERDDDRAHF